MVRVVDKQLPDTVGDALSQAALRRQRWVMVLVACGIFVALNLVVTLLIFMQLDFENDAILASALTPADRTVTHNVFMVLIGATVVQTGLAIRTITNSLFGAAPHHDA